LQQLLRDGGNFFHLRRYKRTKCSRRSDHQAYHELIIASSGSIELGAKRSFLRKTTVEGCRRLRHTPRESF
jgi:hypothetical protein